MVKRDSYAVRISGLADGDHEFSFGLDQKFFASLETSLIETGNVDAEIVLEKKVGVMVLHFSLHGSVEVICDRCLEPFLADVDTKQSIYVKSGDEAGEIEDDVIMIHRDDHEVEVGQLMYEFIVLALPYRKVHPDDEFGESSCDPEMIRRLQDHLQGQHEEEKTDPRWDALKGIGNNKE